MSDQLYEKIKKDCKCVDSLPEYGSGSIWQMEYFYKQLYEDKDALLALWDIETAHPCLHDRMTELWKERYRLVSKDLDLSYDIEFQEYLFATFCVNGLKYMLESNQHFTAEKMVRESRIFFQTMMSTVNWK